MKYVEGLCHPDNNIGEAVDHEDQSHFDVWLGEGRRTKKDQ